MQKVQIYLLSILFLVCLSAPAQEYTVTYRQVDSGAGSPGLLPGKFTNRSDAEIFINNLPATLQARGFVAASVDSIRYDSLVADVVFFAGPRYRWARLRTRAQDAALLQAIRWPLGTMTGKPLDFAQVQAWQNRLLDYLEEKGHPFGKVYLDSISLAPDSVSALLVVDAGPAYTIDSVRIIGDVHLRPDVVGQYLGLNKGSPYTRSKLEAVSTRIRELAYVQEVQPPTVLMQGTGAVVNLFLKPRRSSQINALVGLLPNANPSGANKFRLTGEANILLRNSLGAGETIGLSWQQLQLRSPRLNIQYQHPFIFRKPVGVSFMFDMLRRDSSWLNLNLHFGATHLLKKGSTLTFFVQRRQTILSTVDTTAVRRNRRLPQLADLASTNLGSGLQYSNTDYRINPRKGFEVQVSGSGGTKRVRPNSQVLELKDPAFSFKQLYDTVKLKTYQLRLTASAAHYSALGGQSVLKKGLNLGVFQSGSYYFNELFQVGGYRLLRGFTEESQFLSHYALGTLEYRYLLGPDAYFFGFVDGGWGQNKAIKGEQHTYVGTGLGLSLDTGAGIFNLAWAVGKRNDTGFNLRQSKVHLGFTNFF